MNLGERGSFQAGVMRVKSVRAERGVNCGKDNDCTRETETAGIRAEGAFAIWRTIFVFCVQAGRHTKRINKKRKMFFAILI